MSRLKLRPALATDARRLWEWRNHPAVRASSFKQEEIPWPSHVRWFEQTLASPDAALWILETTNGPVGQIRFERAGDSAEISLSVDPAHQGQGYGSALLSLSLTAACERLAVSTLFGIVKKDNVASRRAFERSGFEAADTLDREGFACIRYQRGCRSVNSNV